MDLVQLRTLVNVAELGSLSKAADRMGIAQPALSRQLRRLEEELGASLFVRHGRGMTLTDLGLQALAIAHRIFAGTSEILALAKGNAAPVTGHVRFGMTPTVARIMTAPLVRAVRSAHPDLTLSITTGFSGHLIEWLKRDQIDCCIAYDLNDLGLLRVRPILDESLFLIGSTARDLVQDHGLEFATLAEEVLLLPSPLHGLRRIIDRHAEQAGVKLRTVIEADSFEALITLVQEGFGSTILPFAALRDQIESGRLIATPLKDPTPLRRVVMAYPADRTLSAAARAVGALFDQAAIEVVNAGAWKGEVVLKAQPGNL